MLASIKASTLESRPERPKNRAPDAKNRLQRTDFLWFGGEAGIHSVHPWTLPYGQPPAVQNRSRRFCRTLVRIKSCLSARHKKARLIPGFFVSGGEAGIRTLGTVARTTDFESVPFDHSGTSPENIFIGRLPLQLNSTPRRLPTSSYDSTTPPRF